MDRLPLRIASRSVMNLRQQARTDWYKIVRNQAGPAQVMVYDEIGYWGVTAQDFISELMGIDGPLEVHLNTPGGEVFDGIAIFEALSQRKDAVAVIVDSLAASIGSVIAMAASPGQLTMGGNATMMIHDGFGLCVGNAEDMRQAATQLDKTSDNIASIYARRTGKPAADWRTAMKAETWYSAAEAVAAGLADQVRGAESAENRWDLSVYGHAPGQVRSDGTDSAVISPEDNSDPGDHWDPDVFRSALKEAL